MEPPCSSTYHIPDDVYLQENCPIRDSSIIESPLVVTEDHSGIHRVYKQLTEELPQLGSFIRDHTRSYVFGLSSAYSNRLFLPSHPGYRTEPKENQHSEVLLRFSTLPA